MSRQEAAIHPHWFIFRESLKKIWFLPIVSIVGILWMTLPPILQYAQRHPEVFPAQAVPHGEINYILISEYALRPGTAALAFGMALLLFRFLNDKKMVSVHYSLGVTRTGLVFPRLLAGALMLLAGLIPPIFVLAQVNAHYFGATPALRISAVYLCCAALMVGLLTLGITAAMFSSTGISGEAAFFSLTLLLAPSLYSLPLLMLGDGYSFARELTARLSNYNPLLFRADKIPPVFVPHDFSEYEEMLNPKWQSPDFAALIPWALAALGSCALAVWLFHRRPAERVGFPGKNRVMNFVCTALLGLFPFGTIVMFYPDYAPVSSFFVGLFAYAPVYLALEFILLRDPRLVKRGLPKFAGHVALALGLWLWIQTWR